MNWIFPKQVLLIPMKTRRPRSGAQSASRIYQFVGGGLTEIDAEFKFAKIQNSYVEGGGGPCVNWCGVQIC